MAAGFFVGTGSLFLLLSLGAAIGFTSVDPRDLASWKHMGVGVGIWGLVAAVVSSFFAAWVAARLSAATERRVGILHGVTLWGLTWAVALWIGAMAIGGAVDNVSRAVPTAAMALKGAASGDANRQGTDAVGAPAQVEGTANRGSNTTTPAEAGEAAAKGGKTGAWGAFLVALLTLVASGLGGSLALTDRSRRAAAEFPARAGAGQLSHGRV